MTPSSPLSSKKSESYTVVACDDGYIEKVGKGSTLLACISWKGRGPGAPARGALALLRVDGADATSIVSALASILALPGKPLLLLDSITIAGFDAVSPSGFKMLTGGELIVVYTRRPRRERLLEALRRSGAALRDAKERIILWMLEHIFEVETSRGRLYLASTLSRDDAISVVESLQAHARVPEPLRVAHATASRASMELKGKRCI